MKEYQGREGPRARTIGPGRSTGYWLALLDLLSLLSYYTTKDHLPRNSISHRELSHPKLNFNQGNSRKLTYMSF